ncbi:MAG: hypothetical protein JOZ07_19125 [Solirubrobacterales bacterium]|nr:hypothetical protein [Solirubrobacterales bacterium]
MRRLVLISPAAATCRGHFDELAGVEVVERYDLAETPDTSRLAAGLAGAWAVVAGGEPYDRTTLAAADDLRAIVRWGTGSDAIDVGAATAREVAVVTMPGANSEAVADLALTLMLGCLRRLPELEAAARGRDWRPPSPAGDLAEATVGIVGLGAIGRAVARRLRGFGCRVLAVEPAPDIDFCRHYEVEPASLADMLSQVDAVTLHTPLSPSTHHIIGAPELARLPRHAVVINTARGQLIDQPALVRALAEGAIAGAGLDVFEREPLPENDPLRTLPNVIVTGHAASFTRLGMGRTGEAVLAALRSMLHGRLPDGCLNPETWG